ncbi:MAG: hypothetical protein WBN88_07470, partial [Anderseniella sp.]
MTSFSKSPDSIDVTNAAQAVTCNMTIPTGAGGGPGNVVEFAICRFSNGGNSPDQSCVADAPIGDVWSCPVTIPEDSYGSPGGETWTVKYVFAQDDKVPPGKLFVTGAEMVADTGAGGAGGYGVLGGDPTEVDLTVISSTPDTTKPEITSFTVIPSSIVPGDTVTCTFSIVETGSGLERVGCSFVPDDGSKSVSCTSESGQDSCPITIPGTADAGVTYTQINHFARDVALNVTVATNAEGFSSGAPTIYWSSNEQNTGTPPYGFSQVGCCNPGDATCTEAKCTDGIGGGSEFDRVVSGTGYALRHYASYSGGGIRSQG